MESLNELLKKLEGIGGWIALGVIVIIIMIAALSGCSREADVASRNLSNAADDFSIMRRIVFYNSITGEYMLSVEGLCALGNYDKSREMSVTCKVGVGQYKKHFLGLSDNVTFFAEQIDPSTVDVFHYSVVFSPTTMIPDVKVR